MKKGILTLLFLLTLIQVYSQTEKNKNIHFIKFKVYQGNFETGVPFAEMCFSDNKDEMNLNCATTDFDGYASFYLNSDKYNPDSTFIKIRISKGNAKNDFGNLIKIPLNKIEIMKDFDLDNDLKIVIVDYKILSEKEYKKYRKNNGLMPDRNPTKAKDVK